VHRKRTCRKNEYLGSNDGLPGSLSCANLLIGLPVEVPAVRFHRLDTQPGGLLTKAYRLQVNLDVWLQLPTG
jgi:hypothetical protein